MEKTKFDWIDFIKRVAAIAVPVALQNLLTTTGSMVDTMMIAPLGETSVAAVGLCAQLATLIFSFYWGFVGGGMLFFAQYWGAKDYKGINRAYGTTLVFMMSVATVFTVASFLAPRFVMSIFTDKTAILDIAQKYLKIVCLSYPFVIFSVGASSLLRSTESVKIPLYASITSVAANMFLNWVFIFGKLGCKPMGAEGAAWATVAASVINTAMIFILSKRAGYPFIFSFKEHFHWTGSWIKEYLKKCFPIICNELFVGIGFTVSNVVMGRQPEEAVAALAVFKTIESLIVGFFAGFSNAASVLVGKCIGNGDIKTAYSRATRLVFFCDIIIFVVCAVIFCFHTPLLHAMSLSGKSFEYGTQMLLIYFCAALIRMCNWMQNDTFRSAGDTSFGTLNEIIFMYVMVIPAVCLAGFVFKLPTAAVFACSYIDEPIRFVIMQKHLYSGKWIKPVTPQGKKAVGEFLAAKSKRKEHQSKSGI